MLRLLNASLLFVAVSVSAQDSTNSASVTIRESLHRSYRLITPRPGGIGPIVYNDHGRTSFAASSVLKDFDLSRAGTNSSVGIEIGDYKWEQPFRLDKRWKPGHSILHLKGHDSDTLVDFRSVTVRWKGDDLRIRARAKYSRNEIYGGSEGFSFVAWRHISELRGLLTNNLPIAVFVRSVPDDAPGQTNTFYGTTNVPTLINVNTREVMVPHETAMPGSVRVETLPK